MPALRLSTRPARLNRSESPLVWAAAIPISLCVVLWFSSEVSHRAKAEVVSILLDVVTPSLALESMAIASPYMRVTCRREAVGLSAGKVRAVAGRIHG